jgi:hypothetical protein
MPSLVEAGVAVAFFMRPLPCATVRRRLIFVTILAQSAAKFT